MFDDRGLSVTVNYVLGLSIAFLLVAGILLTGSDFVQDQRETSVKTEMEVLGEQISSDIAQADLMVRAATGNEAITVRRSLPNRIAGSSYTITIEGGSDPYLVLESNDPQISVEANFTSVTDVEETSISGGSIVVTYEVSSDELVLERGDR